MPRPRTVTRSLTASEEANETFEWRVPIDAWRWWLLGSLGVASSACYDSPTPPLPAPAPVASTTPDRFGCVGGVPLGGAFSYCASGFIHRTEAEVCPSVVPRPEVLFAPGPPEYADAGPASWCVRDSDCSAAPGGYCTGYFEGYCEYGCTRDSDCSADEICLCGELTGSCRAASCRTDSDCAEGSSCVGTVTLGCSTAFSCLTPDDECWSDTDCAVDQRCIRQALDPSNPDGELQPNRTCGAPLCFEVGRPFLIGGSERVAASVERNDWYTPGPGLPRAISVADPALRSELARGWLAQARMEHASVAAFARFSLQLLALGAPADLVQRTAEAVQDEIRHARACFELARQYGGEDVGPGPLDITGAIEDIDLTSIVLCTLHEGCIGETLAALEAAEALQHCEDPAARAVLESIAAEEARHAELAWRFVAWALEGGPESLPERVRATFAEVLTERGTGDAQVGAFDHALARHGLLSTPLRAALRARVLSEVIAPCARALLGGLAPKGPGRAVPRGYSFASTT